MTKEQQQSKRLQMDWLVQAVGAGLNNRADYS